MTTAMGTAPLDRPPVRSRVSPVTAFRQGLILAWRNLVKLKISPAQIFVAAIQPMVLTLLFVFMFGGAIQGNRHDYLQFVLPGIIVQSMTLLTASVGTGLATDLNTGIFDRFRSMPIGRSAPLVGAILGDLVRHVISFVLVLGFGMALGFRITTDPLSTLAALALIMVFSFAMCWVSVVLGLLLKTPEAMSSIGIFALLPLTFGNNTLVATDTLPGWLQAWVKINPVTHTTDAVRALLAPKGAESAASPAIYTLLASAAILVVVVPIALRLFLRRK
ncbi:ABC transporter permease [Streptomyces rubellomurinus]|uniref:Transport permease protein n=2 Tax=Streptomyces TaxID=1883 RepID=A0A0F2TES9_STRR3|nr:ABC transporter permease [Streptomyces rubellomurinus]KJS53065.1 hypothetical protein VM98_27490 [Streptomyces rubellomurinus subsp. indigoferus]KJS61708.1 hypothetical protein VM95_13380 [Streptomyces rubellomurinus]